jgi:hypothetical protein
MIIEGQVGPVRYNDGGKAVLRIGNSGEQLVGHLNPKYFEQTLRGNAFIYSVTTAVSVIAPAATGAPTLWNPLGSGILCVLNKITIQVAAIGTPVISGFQYAYQTGVGANIATLAPVATFTDVKAVNLFLGGKNSKVSQMKFAPATDTGLSPTVFGGMGVNLGATSTQTPWTGMDDVDGRIIIAPGTLFQIGASTATSTTFNISIWGVEIPDALSA